MGGTLGTIIVIVIALWGVISQVLEAAARKAKEKRRLEEAQERAARELGVTVQQPEQASPTFKMGTGTATVARQGPAPIPTPMSPHGHPARPTGATLGQPPAFPQRPKGTARTPSRGQRITDAELAARRREQIEQLRQRRAASGGRAGLPPSPVGTPPQQAAQPQKRRSKQAGAASRRIQAAERDVQTSAVPPASVARPNPYAQGQARAAAQPEARDAYSLPRNAGAPGVSAAQSQPQGVNAAAVAKLLGDPASLRQVFLAAELLGPPVAMRPERELGELGG